MTDVFNRVDISDWLERIPYASYLGISATLDHEQESLLFRLEPFDSNVGNILLPALHGGVVAAFMETAATLDLLRVAHVPTLPRIVDLSIDYLRTARTVPTFAQCDVLREGRRLANVRVSAWQDDSETPIATARLHFVLGKASSYNE
ncbi:PaaI family thioesterase [Halomonas halocynthiae]|uniref:PaaI family thioesterase n=1 Tax=Halomonas halocynthiae TaxID=176290 RepID=UPI0003FF2731|nr:PaaI family thioesterase [Halomonas halocynthiae]